MTSAALRLTRSLIATACAALTLSACGGGDDTPVPEAAFTLQLLHFADADGSDTTALKSVANFSGLVNKFRAQYPQQTPAGYPGGYPPQAPPPAPLYQQGPPPQRAGGGGCIQACLACTCLCVLCEMCTGGDGFF